MEAVGSGCDRSQVVSVVRLASVFLGTGVFGVLELEVKVVVIMAVAGR